MFLLLLANSSRRSPRARWTIGGAGTLNVAPFVAGGGTVHLIVDVTGYFE